MLLAGQTLRPHAIYEILYSLSLDAYERRRAHGRIAVTYELKVGGVEVGQIGIAAEATQALKQFSATDPLVDQDHWALS